MWSPSPSPPPISPCCWRGVLLGPWEAMALGGVFGLASMWKATAHYVVNTDQLFSPTTSGNPFGSFVLSVVSRMLFGLLVGAAAAVLPQRPAGGGMGGPGGLPGALPPRPAGVRGHGPLLSGGGVWPGGGGGGPGHPQRRGHQAGSPWPSSWWSGGWTGPKGGTSSLFQVEAARKFSAGERYHRLSMVLVLIVTTCSAGGGGHLLRPADEQGPLPGGHPAVGDPLRGPAPPADPVPHRHPVHDGPGDRLSHLQPRYATYKNAEAKRDASPG